MCNRIIRGAILAKDQYDEFGNLILNDAIETEDSDPAEAIFDAITKFCEGNLANRGYIPVIVASDGYNQIELSQSVFKDYFEAYRDNDYDKLFRTMDGIMEFADANEEFGQVSIGVAAVGWEQIKE